MSVNMDVGASVPARHFRAAGLEAEPDANSRDRMRDLKLGVAMTLGVFASCALSVLVFLS
jgi:hypothetical protein